MKKSIYISCTILCMHIAQINTTTIKPAEHTETKERLGRKRRRQHCSRPATTTSTTNADHHTTEPNTDYTQQ